MDNAPQTLTPGNTGRLIAIIALMGLLVGACNQTLQNDPNSDSGGDGERSKAQILVLGEPVNDRVSYTEGDMTDWKYVQVPAPGTLTVTLGCDSTGASCQVHIRNEVGRLVQTISTSGQPRITDDVEVPARGNYYVEVMAQASSSDYTIQVDYEPY